MLALGRRDPEAVRLLRGFEQALERFKAARQRHDAEAAYFALFEALNWAVSLDDKLTTLSSKRRAWRGCVPEGDVVAGLRLARNRVHHQWADALNPTNPGASGQLGRMQLGQARLGAVPEWIWKLRPDLPPPSKRHPDGKRAQNSYDAHVAGEKDMSVLDRLLRALTDAVT